MYRIGIIDDNLFEVDDIQATIYTVWTKHNDAPNEVDFKHYELSSSPSFKDELLKELLYDIKNSIIQSLIIDYKLDSLRTVLEGKDIVDFLRDQVPFFPVIILTNAPQGSKAEEKIDPDKVYDKRSFFDLNSTKSYEMAFNIFLNIKRYINRRNELEQNLAAALNELTTRAGADVDISLISQISKIEEELSDYTITGQSYAERAFDLSELRELINELQAIGNSEG